jgi:hypothetical protein
MLRSSIRFHPEASMADGQEREWLVFLGGPSGIVEVRVRSAVPPSFGAGRVMLGDASFSRTAFMGAIPEGDVADHTVRMVG